MKISSLIIAICLALTIFGCGKTADILLDDFEGTISGGKQGTVDFGAGEGSSVEVSASKDIKYSGKQSLKVSFDAVSGGYMWVARGFDLDAQNTQWRMRPERINWKKYCAFSFYMYGKNSGAKIAFDIKDNGNELWRFMLEDNFSGWKQIICPFDKFFARGDWQPDDADRNAALNFPIKSFQFEPRPIARGTLYFDKVELIRK